MDRLLATDRLDALCHADEESVDAWIERAAAMPCIAADHPHHIVYRSAGGSDDPGNQISLCAAHHLHGVHMGWIRVSGTAPDGLRWELGVGAAP